MKECIQFNFSQLEKALWESTMETFRQAMVEILCLIDDFLLEKRDKRRYELKAMRERTYVTCVGTVNIKRRYYWDHDKQDWVFLLDEVLGIEKSKQISASLKEIAVIWATKGPSYRDTRDRLKDLFCSQILSHEKIRQLLIHSSDTIKNTYKKEPEKKKKVDILFIEADGFWTGVQKEGKRRQKKKRETHMIKIHEGWEKRQGKEKEDYKLKNPMYVTSDNLEEDEELWDRVRLRITERYQSIDGIPIIINGDFASWIRAGVDCFGNAMYQWDGFHLKRDIGTLLNKDKRLRNQALSLVDDNDPDGLLGVLDEYIGSITDLSEYEKVKELRKRVPDHKEATIDYRERLRDKGVEVSKSWRGMGAAESNVDRFKLRTSKRGRAWSKKGLASILNMLGMLYEGTLKEALVGIENTIFTKEQTEEIVEMSAHQVSKKVGGEVVNVRKGDFPAANTGTKGYSKLFRQILNLEMI